MWCGVDRSNSCLLLFGVLCEVADNTVFTLICFTAKLCVI